MDTINVLITSCGRRVELVKEFIKARESLGIKGIVVCADMSISAPAMFFSEAKEIVPRLTDNSYISRLIEIINKHDIKLIVPTIDTELQLLADNKESIESRTKAKVLISSCDIIEICNNKFLSTKFFKDNGFAVPYTLSNDEIVRGNYKLPLFIKPQSGSSSINAFKIKNKKELDFFIDYIENPIVQELITGIEYTVDAFLDFNSNIISVVPRKRLSTRSGEILKGEIDMNKHIIDDVTKMLNILKPIGHITVQGFLGEDNVFRYIEINPRFGGGAPMSIKAGANSPKYLYQLLLGRKIDKVNVLDKVIFSRFDDCVMVNRND